MSAKQRSEAFHRAARKGGDAFWQGKPRDSNPYKFSEWGNGGAWDMGWLKGKGAAKKGGRHALYGNPLKDNASVT